MRFCFFLIPFFSHYAARKIGRKIRINSIKSHKDIREKHGVSPLKFDPRLEQYATSWCRFMAKRDIFKHSPTKKYGENLYLAVRRADKEGVEITEIVGRAVKRWWKEILLYDFDSPGYSPETGHFTLVSRAGRDGTLYSGK